MKIDHWEIGYRILFVVVGCCFIFLSLSFSMDHVIAINYFPDKPSPPISWQAKLCLIVVILSFIEAVFTIMRDKFK
jgi:hypothetical protein